MTRVSKHLFPSIVILVVLLAPLVAASHANHDDELVARPEGSPTLDEPDRPAGCSPIPLGDDLFPSTAKIVLDVYGDASEPFVVRLSSAGLPNTVMHRDTQVGDTIDTELVQMDLSGAHPGTGSIQLRAGSFFGLPASDGEITDVVLDPGCELINGNAFFELFIELDLPGIGETWINQDPIRVESELAALPPADELFERTVATPVTLFDSTTMDSRGEISYLLQHADPQYPPAGIDCFDSQFSADIELTGPSINTTLTGSGTTAVQRSGALPRTCTVTGESCEEDSDCPGLVNVCATSRIDTEIVQLDLTGTDPFVGDWQIHVIPAGGFSDCCDSHPTPGCNDPVCENIICTQDPFCCQTEWDELCASLADSDETCEPNCFDPNALPSTGQVESASGNSTYPASSSFDLYIKLETQLQGNVLNPGSDPLPMQATAPLNNTPPDPGTVNQSAPGPVPLVTENINPAGEIENVSHTLDLPVDCDPPPAAGADCFDSTLDLTVTLPGCPTETLSLTGSLLAMRDAPADPGGVGQEVIQTVAAKSTYTGVSPCAGALSLRLDPTGASLGQIASLAPEEFFPAESYVDLLFEIVTAGGTLHGGPARLETTINAIPADEGEVYFGPDTIVDLFDSGEVKVGELLEISRTIGAPIACPADCAATILFPGPSSDEITLRIPDGGDGVVYDLVRGDLLFLRNTGGNFITSQCMQTDGPPDFVDGSDPGTDQGYYYVAREGLGAYDGTWNSGGTAQIDDRDVKITTPPCP